MKTLTESRDGTHGILLDDGRLLAMEVHSDGKYDDLLWVLRESPDSGEVVDTGRPSAYKDEVLRQVNNRFGSTVSERFWRLYGL